MGEENRARSSSYVERSGIAARLLGSPGPGYFNTGGGRPPTWGRAGEGEHDDGAVRRWVCRVCARVCVVRRCVRRASAHALSRAPMYTRVTRTQPSVYRSPRRRPAASPRLRARPSRGGSGVHGFASYGFTRSFDDERREEAPVAHGSAAPLFGFPARGAGAQGGTGSASVSLSGARRGISRPSLSPRNLTVCGGPEGGRGPERSRRARRR